MPDPVATYKWSAPVLAKEQTTTKRKQTNTTTTTTTKKRSRMGAVLLVGDDGGCFQSINQSINHSVSLLGRAEIVLKRQMFKKNLKKSNHSLVFLYLCPWVEKSCLFSCGHEPKRVVSLVVAMSQEELCLYLWPWAEKSCLFSCGHEPRRVVTLLVAMSRKELSL